ncbi:MAG: SBBP repeat-containing protein, partial [Deltaproteobacteria bacterium]|nr:SBBP repeat-containing protein [Deltaproteobacteria bacterium]
MKTNRELRFLTALVVFLFFVSFLASSAAAAPPKADRENVLKAYGKLPLYFIENKGQMDSKVKFYVKTSGQTLYFTDEGIVFDLLRGEKNAGKGIEGAEKGRQTKAISKERLVFNLGFEHARKGIPIEGLDRQAARINSFTGNDRSTWKTGIPTYKGVVYRGIYKGIDLKAFGNGADVEYEFIVHPGGDPRDILLTYHGIEGLAANGEGELLITTAFGELKETRPYIYQEIEGKKAVDGGFEIRGPADKSQIGKFSYGFKVAAYNPSYPLVIDPILSYSTYLGGNGDDFGYGIAVDASGNAYVTGATDSSDFPTHNPYQGTRANLKDVFVTKISSTGNALAYSTYLGGSGGDYGQGIAVDASGNAYVTGYTYSSDFPTHSAYQATHGGNCDAFVTKVSSSGSALAYSTYLGGSGDDYGYGIAVDASGNAYVTGSVGSDDFPTQTPYQGDKKESTDAFATKVSSTGTTLAYSTYLGGSGYDHGYGIAVDASGNAYVTGYTYSSDFPTQNPYQGDIAGEADVFATKISSTGTTLAYSTYLGGSGDDYGYGIAVDASGNAYVAGETKSSDFPTQNAYQGTYNEFSDAFATKVSSTGTTLAYSTYLGGRGYDCAYGIVVDASGSAYVAGVTFCSDFPTQNPHQGTIAGSLDAFATKVSSSGSALSFSTYLGGSGYDSVYGIAVDASGNAYVAGETRSSNFPTHSAYQATHGGNADAFIAKLSPSAVHSYYIPYYKVDPTDYYSSLALRNSSATTGATVTVAAYESDGTPVPLAAGFTGFTIDASGQWAQVLPRLDVEGWVLVTSTQPLTGLAWVGKL